LFIWLFGNQGFVTGVEESQTMEVQNMNTTALQPVTHFPLQPGQKRDYHGVTISLGPDGRLIAPGGLTGCIVSFTRRERMGAWRGFAALKGGIVYVFEGATIGQGMIDEQEVRAALGL